MVCLDPAELKGLIRAGHRGAWSENDQESQNGDGDGEGQQEGGVGYGPSDCGDSVSEGVFRVAHTIDVCGWLDFLHSRGTFSPPTDASTGAPAKNARCSTGPTTPIGALTPLGPRVAIYAPAIPSAARWLARGLHVLYAPGAVAGAGSRHGNGTTAGGSGTSSGARALRSRGREQ